MKTSSQYLKEKIAKLREQIASLEAENDRLYQQACKAEEELLKYKAEPSKVHGAYERIVICDDNELEKELKKYKAEPELKGSNKKMVCFNSCKYESISKFTYPCSDCCMGTGNNMNWQPNPKPVYIPFTFEDAEMLIGKAVKGKTHGVFGIVTWVLHDCVEIGADTVAFSALLEWYTFLDGSPCGKLAE